MKKRSVNPILQGYNPVSYVWHSRWGWGVVYEWQSLNTATCNLKSEKSAIAHSKNIF